MYIVWLGVLPLLWVMGIRDWRPAVLLAVLILVTSAVTYWHSLSSDRATPRSLIGPMLLNCAVVATCSCILGPLIIVPGVAASSAAAFVVGVREKSNLRRLPFLLAIVAVFVPLLLEHFGVLPRAYTFDGDVITVHPFVARFTPAPTAVSLVIVTFVQLALPSVILNRSIDALVDAERRSFVQAWRLRHLLPSRAKTE